MSKTRGGKDADKSGAPRGFGKKDECPVPFNPLPPAILLSSLSRDFPIPGGWAKQGVAGPGSTALKRRLDVK